MAQTVKKSACNAGDLGSIPGLGRSPGGGHGNAFQYFCLDKNACLGYSVQWALCRQEYWSGLPCPPPGDLPNPGIEPRSPALQADSLPAEPQGKPKNTGVGSHSLLQGIFLTQGSNPGLPHCRQILFCLSHQGSPSLSYGSQILQTLK